MSLLNSLGTGLQAFGKMGISEEIADQERARRLALLDTPRVAPEPPPAKLTPTYDDLAKPTGTLAQVMDAIYGQESGHGRNTTTSVTGARGGMQIQPATFAQYAREGESIDNPDHNLAVGRRIIMDLWKRGGEDPARVAVGYFSGPRNIAPPGSPTPWKRNTGDPNGMTTSRYVGSVLKRMGLMPGMDT